MVERSIILLFALGSKLWLIVAVVVALALLPINQVSANGLHVGAVQFSGRAGPYDIMVFVTPKVGNLHMTVFVSPLGSADPVSDAVVQVSGRGPQSVSQIVGPVPAVRSLTAWYSANLLIEEAGEWVFTLTVASSLGEATMDIPVEVQESGSINWGVIGAVAFFLAMVAWLAFLQRRRKSR